MKRIVCAMLGMGFLCFQAATPSTAGETKPPLKVTVVTGANQDGPTVLLTVTNTSDTYQIYQSISCSWQDYWQTDDKGAIVAGQSECGKNSSFTRILAPGEKYAERPSQLLFRGKPGRRTVRFGYSRHVSDFTSAELKQIYNSPEKLTYFSRTDVAKRFKPARETFWSAAITIDVPTAAILH